MKCKDKEAVFGHVHLSPGKLVNYRRNPFPSRPNKTTIGRLYNEHEHNSAEQARNSCMIEMPFAMEIKVHAEEHDPLRGIRNGDYTVYENRMNLQTK